MSSPVLPLLSFLSLTLSPGHKYLHFIDRKTETQRSNLSNITWLSVRMDIHIYLVQMSPPQWGQATLIKLAPFQNLLIPSVVIMVLVSLSIAYLPIECMLHAGKVLSVSFTFMSPVPGNRATIPQYLLNDWLVEWMNDIQASHSLIHCTKVRNLYEVSG